MRAGPNAAGYVVLALIAVALIALWLYGTHYLYGDWRCAFAQCRIEVGR